MRAYLYRIVYIVNRHKYFTIVYLYFRNTCIGRVRAIICSDITINDNVTVLVIRFYSSNESFLCIPVFSRWIYSVVIITRTIDRLATTVDGDPFTVDTNHSWRDTRRGDTASDTTSRNCGEERTAFHTTLFVYR